MQFEVTANLLRGARHMHSRLAAMADDLGIAGYQQAPWDVFVEIVLAVEDAVTRIRADLPRERDKLPALPDFMRARTAQLASDLKAARILGAGVGGLYRSLSSKQRARADRLLPPLLAGLMGASDPARCTAH